MNIYKIVVLIFLGSLSPEILATSSAEGLSADSEARLRADLQAQDRDNPSLNAYNALRRRAIDPVQAAANRIEILQTIDELKNDPDGDPARILTDIHRENSIDSEVAEQKEIDALKWQNTLLTPPSSPIGLYKGDFIQSGLLVAEIVSDVKLFKELTRRRKEHILQAIFSDIDLFIALLKQVNDSENRYEERMAGMSGFAQMFTDQVRARTILLNPLRRYLIEHHSLMKGYVPISSETIVPLFVRWLTEKVTDWAHDKLLVRSLWAKIDTMTYADILKKSMNPRLQENIEARTLAFQPNKAGYLRALSLPQTPFSVTTCFKGLLFVINPVKGIQKIIDSDTSNPWPWRAWFANKVTGFGLPDFLFSDPIKLSFEVAGIVLAAKYHDEGNTARWGTYVLSHRDELLTLLLNYRTALDNASSGDTVIAQAAHEIRAYVDKGHEAVGLFAGEEIRNELSQWWFNREAGRNLIHTIMAAGTIGLVSLKLAHVWLTRNNQLQEEIN